ncbi:hypothetical protein [Salmonirosea aquatica]|uniref:Secreted protein n=1 Tax=Salmonirosea aquatica TaxID=2654236 RepID=A0A7C9BVW2_9BACT|nr:hypothetical protein [Cytophagaceae bacterium SJW1-29]
MRNLIACIVAALLTLTAPPAHSWNATAQPDTLTPTEVRQLTSLTPQIIKELKICDEARQINGLLNAKIQTLIAETSRQETEINDAQQGLKEETARRSVMERRAKRRGNVVLVETLVIAAAIVTKIFL